MVVINNKYELIKKIGEGNYGIIYKGEHRYLDKYVAIKIAKQNGKTILKNEAKIYKLLDGIDGVPSLLLYGVENNSNYLITQLMDHQLLDIEDITINNTYNLGIKMINIISNIHAHGIIHRDIKPDNFMIKDTNLYLLDYGLSTTYLDMNNEHISIKYIDNIIGSINYISINVHNNIIPSRRDDLESIIYILIFVLYKSLPWNKNMTVDEIKYSKENIIDNTYIDSRLIDILTYIKSIEFNILPDYKLIINKFGIN
jgi:serine/threonine protein kinase